MNALQMSPGNQRVIQERRVGGMYCARCKRVYRSHPPRSCVLCGDRLVPAAPGSR